MKKMLFILLLGFQSAISFSQTPQVLACQFNQSNGLSWDSQKWNPTKFIPGKPFFLRINEKGEIDPMSIEKLLFFPDDTRCKVRKSSVTGLRTACSEIDSGTSIVINLETLSGAYSYMLGAAAKSIPNGESSYISLFSCQRM